MKINKHRLRLAGLLLLAALLPGCAHPYVGTYVNETLPEHHVELKKDHTFVVVEAGGTFKGKYLVKGQTITMDTTLGNTATGTLSTNVLVDQHGGKWLKQ